MAESKARVTKITATSRVAVKARDNYYTIEYSEERSIPNVKNIDMDLERELLFNDVNTTVDQQVADIINSLKR